MPTVKKPQQIIIGLVGEKGAGKETFGELLANLLKNRKVYRTRTADILNETLDLWSINNSRSNLQRLAVTMRNMYGPDAISHAIQQRILKNDGEIVILDGIRWEPDRRLVRSFKKSFLVYVTADARTRYRRTVKRKQKHGEEHTTFEQFMHEELAETELDIPRIGATADFKVKNEGTLENLQQQVEKFYQEFLKVE